VTLVAGVTGDLAEMITDHWPFAHILTVENHGRDILPFLPSFGRMFPGRNTPHSVRQADMGLCLVDTRHPSYPPLDLAASGAVAITNSCGLKTSLAQYSENILCVAPTIDNLQQAIRQASEIALNEQVRSANYARNRMKRSWTESFEPVLQRCSDWPG